jgi:uncharacterized protein (TIGR02246 family)
MTMDLDEQVTAVFDATSSAWADGDADAFAAWYSEEATVILPGVSIRGRDGIRTSMGGAFAGPLKGSRRFHVVRDARLLGDTALVVTRSVTKFPGEATGGEDELATWALSRHDGRWLIEAYHSGPAA